MVNGPLLDGRGNHLPAQIRMYLSFIAEVPTKTVPFDFHAKRPVEFDSGI